MKKNILLLFSFFSAAVLYAQNVVLTDSVIYIDNKPVALYHKELSKSTPRYNIEVYNFTKELLLKAEVIKFEAPVEELQPFFYYEFAFSTGDTTAIYVEDEAFSLVLANLIKEYNLISNNKLNTDALSKFRHTYPGIAALTVKIKAFEDYLDETRSFSQQVKRDRSKPVKILNDRIIMQDGKKIGLIYEVNNYTESNRYSLTTTTNSTPSTTFVDKKTNTITATEFYLSNGKKVEVKKNYRDYNTSSLSEEKGEVLYKASKTKKINTGSYTDWLLRRICFLIEDFSL